MAFPLGTASQGTNPATAYSGTFIPEVWSGKLIEKFYLATVFGAIANTDYEGEITSYGDKVKIRQRPDVTISTYNPDVDLSIERPSQATVELLIDQGKYFNTMLDDVYKVQSDIDLMNEWSADAAEQMKIKIDRQVLGYMNGKATSGTNRGRFAGAISGDGATVGIDLGDATTPRTLAAADVLDFVVDLGTVLDEVNRPESGRWLVMPAWACAMIKKSDLRDASIAGDGTSILRNGRLGMIDRFTIYMSNQLPDLALTAEAAADTDANIADPGLAAGEFIAYAGINNAVTFASQMTNTETIRSERTFGNLMRGLQVFGREVVDGDSLVEAVIKK